MSVTTTSSSSVSGAIAAFGSRAGTTFAPETVLPIREIWKPIAGYEGYYEVSDQGRVKSLDRIIEVKNYTMKTRRIRGKFLSDCVGTLGYSVVALCRNGQTIITFVHRIVATAFVSNPNGCPQVDHLNCIRSDNRAENLSWVTCEENTHRTVKRRRCASKLTWEAAEQIRSEYDKNKANGPEIALKYGVDRSVIYDVVHFKTWYLKPYDAGV